MRVHRHPDAVSFLAAAEMFLTQREALHNLPLAIARHCVADPSRYAGPNYFAVVEEGGIVCGIAAMTPPHRLQLYVAPGAAVRAVEDDLAVSTFTPPGVHGPVAAATEFAAAWCAGRGRRPDLRMNLRAFELTAVIPAPAARGRLRRAEAADSPLVESWYRAFSDEAHAAQSNIPPEEVGRRAVRDGRVFLWDDGGPAAQAAIGGMTPSGARVGAVYTPAVHRRRGYATALVGAFSQHLLDEGSRFCFLFTDLANPVSNSIYPKVGYRQVGDFRDYDFVEG